MIKTNPNSIKLEILKIFGPKHRKLVSNLELKLEKWKKIESVHLNKASEQRKVNMTELDKKIQDLEINHQESMWE